jgi:phospholipid-translocating ATPase
MSLNFATVICCRLLPIQKAQTVKLIRSHLNKVCLAIGDGGNDVSMLK